MASKTVTLTFDTCNMCPFVLWLGLKANCGKSLVPDTFGTQIEEIERSGELVEIPNWCPLSDSETTE